MHEIHEIPNPNREETHMNAQQALRARRREQRHEQEQAEGIGSMLAVAALLLALAVALALVPIVEGGRTDADLERAEIARWEERGVTIARW